MTRRVQLQLSTPTTIYLCNESPRRIPRQTQAIHLKTYDNACTYVLQLIRRCQSEGNGKAEGGFGLQEASRAEAPAPTYVLPGPWAEALERKRQDWTRFETHALSGVRRVGFEAASAGIGEVCIPGEVGCHWVIVEEGRAQSPTNTLL